MLIPIMLLVGFGLSLFYGLEAVRIFGYPGKNEKLPELAPSWYIHQFWFNFAGSFAGWLLLAHFARNFFYSYNFEASVGDGLLLILALLGVVGLLPSFLAQVPEALKWLTTRSAGEIYKK